MEKKHLISAGWLVLPLATFALGWGLKPNSTPRDQNEPGAQSISHRGSNAGGAGSRAPGGRSGIGSGSATGQADRLGTTEVGSGKPLSTAQIKMLGQEFRSTLDPIKRRAAFLKLLDGITIENARTMREEIADLDHNNPAFRDFHYAWGKIGGVDAIMHGADTKKPDMGATLAGWASADPDAAKAWFDSLGDKNEGFANRSYLKNGMVQGLADSNPRAATEFVLALVAAGDREAGHLMGIVTGKVLQSEGPEAAAAWAATLPEGEMRNSTMSHIARDFVGANPEAAAQWASQLSGQPEGNRVIDQVGGRWARRDPEAAVAWLESLPSSSGQARGMDSAFSSWAGRNPEEAGNYINAMTPSPRRDSAISGYASRMAYENPTMAIAWAESVSDPNARQEAIIRTGQIFYRHRRGDAQQWLASSGLSEEAQNRVTGRRSRDR